MNVQSVGMNHYTDEQLVRLYVDTQRNRFFEELYERYSDKVYRKCLSFVKNQAQAEDFTHDIFLKLIVRIGTFKETSKFSTGNGCQTTQKGIGIPTSRGAHDFVDEIPRRF